MRRWWNTKWRERTSRWLTNLRDRAWWLAVMVARWRGDLLDQRYSSAPLAKPSPPLASLRCVCFRFAHPQALPRQPVATPEHCMVDPLPFLCTWGRRCPVLYPFLSPTPKAAFKNKNKASSHWRVGLGVQVFFCRSYHHATVHVICHGGKTTSETAIAFVLVL